MIFLHFLNPFFICFKLSLYLTKTVNSIFLHSKIRLFTFDVLYIPLIKFFVLAENSTVFQAKNVSMKKYHFLNNLCVSSFSYSKSQFWGVKITIQESFHPPSWINSNNWNGGRKMITLLAPKNKFFYFLPVLIKKLHFQRLL